MGVNAVHDFDAKSQSQWSNVLTRHSKIYQLLYKEVYFSIDFSNILSKFNVS